MAQLGMGRPLTAPKRFKIEIQSYIPTMLVSVALGVPTVYINISIISVFAPPVEVLF